MKYTVELTETRYIEVIVEADNEQEAQDAAINSCDEWDVVDSDLFVDCVSENDDED